mgnify:CR=1 FL=1
MYNTITNESPGILNKIKTKQANAMNIYRMVFPFNEKLLNFNAKSGISETRRNENTAITATMING